MEIFKMQQAKLIVMGKCEIMLGWMIRAEGVLACNWTEIRTAYQGSCIIAVLGSFLGVE